MKTLVIYSLIPEDQLIYIIPDSEMLPEWDAMLQQANGKIVNVDGLNDGMRWLMSAAANVKEDCDPTVDEKYHCCLAKFKTRLTKNDREITGPFSKVYVSGFYL